MSKPKVSRESKRRMEAFIPIDELKENTPEGGYFGRGRRKSDDKLMPRDLNKLLKEQRKLRDSGMVFEK